MNKIKCRKRILRSSRRLFSAKGYEETMIEDIAQRAEVSKATVYNYFANKESLLIGSVDEVADRVKELAHTGLSDCKNSEQKLRRVLEEFVRASVDYPALSRRMTYLNYSEESALHNTYSGIMALLQELIVAAQNEGVFRSDVEVGELLDVVMGVFLVAQFQWVPPATPEQLGQKLDKYFSAMLSSYYNKAAVD